MRVFEGTEDESGPSVQTPTGISHPTWAADRRCHSHVTTTFPTNGEGRISNWGHVDTTHARKQLVESNVSYHKHSPIGDYIDRTVSSDCLMKRGQ